MADSFKIGNVLPRLFNGSKYETNTSRPSNQATIGNTYNPFAASGMKVDVLTADVFDTTTNFTGNIKTPSVSKIKRMASAFVGSINDIKSSFRNGIESIGAFCSKIKNDITSTWRFLSETKAPSFTDITRSIKSQWEAKQYAKEVNMYASKPIATLRDELSGELSGSISIAA